MRQVLVVGVGGSPVVAPSDPRYRMSDPFATLYGTPKGRGLSAFAVPFRATPRADEE